MNGSDLNIAKYVVTKCVVDRIPINNLQLQNILYLIDFEYRKKTCIHMFANKFEISKLGARIPEIQYAFCGWGAMKIADEYPFEPILDEKKEIIDETLECTRIKTCAALVKLVLAIEGGARMEDVEDE